jgi:hypothetical protein
MAGRKYRLRQGNTNGSTWRSWLKKNILTIVLGLGGIVATIMVGTWVDPLLKEDVRVQSRQIEKLEVTPEGRVRLTTEFYLSNAANLNITITGLHCSNTQANWLQWFYRPCRITSGNESIPFTIEAGKVHSIKAELDIEPAPVAERILKKAFSKGKTDGFEVARELAKNQIDLFDRPLPYQEGMSYGYGTGSGRDLGIRDMFTNTGQGYELTLFTSRGLEVHSDFFGVSFPFIGPF